MFASQAPILTPVVTLVAWTLVMWLWMLFTRVPAIQKARIKLDPQLPRGEQLNQLPARARWKADNYNHLMEQPTVFFAVALALAIMGEGSGINLTLAWAYVVIRIIHSLFQALVNKIEIRFLLFVLSNIPLFWLTINALLKAYT
jgi:hypothetical protein